MDTVARGGNFVRNALPPLSVGVCSTTKEFEEKKKKNNFFPFRVDPFS